VASQLPPSFAFTRDSRLCAVSVRDLVLLLDVASGEEVATLPGESRALTRLAYSPDDRYLAVASTNHQVLLWDIPTLRRELRGIGLDWGTAAD
jgi:WD40 repeat protein